MTSIINMAHHLVFQGSAFQGMTLKGDGLKRSDPIQSKLFRSSLLRNSLLIAGLALAPASAVIAEPAPTDAPVQVQADKQAALPDSKPLPAKDQLTDEEAQAMFEAALQERDSGKVFSAIERFEYILSRRPSLNRARLELAVSYHRASQHDNALREFQAVLDDPETPEKVRLAILAYLGQLSSDELKPEQEHSFSFYTRFGGIYNTNINFAPLRGDRDYNIPDDTDTDSAGVDTFLSASHRYRDNAPLNMGGVATLFEWQSQVSWTGNNYTRTNEFNLNTFSLSTGPALIATGRWRGALNFQFDQTYFGESVLGNFISINPLLTFELGNYRGLTIEASYTDLDFEREEDLGRDADNLLLGAGYTTLLGGVENGLEVGFRLAEHDAELDEFSYQSLEGYLGTFFTLSGIENSNLYLNLNLWQFDFDGPDSVTGTVRDELQSRLIFGYNYDFRDGLLKDWTLNTSYTFTKNDSNIDAFSFEQHLLTVTIARYFI